MNNSILNDFYNQLEELSSLNSWDIINQLKPFDERIEKSIGEKIKTERKVLSLQLNNGDICPLVSTVNQDGDVISYPTVDSFTSEEIEYLKKRNEQSKNPWVISRYSHLLWNITKNNTYAEQALNSYLKVIDIVSKSELVDNHFFNIIQHIQAVIIISEKTKKESERVKEKLISIVKNINIPKFLRVSIIEVIESSKLFKPAEIEFVIPFLNDCVDISDEGAYTFNQTILNLAIKISTRNKKSTSKTYSQLAENQDLILTKHPDESDFVRLTLLGEKAIYYKKAGEKEKSEACLEEYTRLKGTIKLGHFIRKFSDDKTKTINEYLNAICDSLIKLPVDSILNFFLTNDNILINNELLEELVKKGYNNSILNLFTIIEFDENINYRKSKELFSDDKMRFVYFSTHYTFFVFTLIIKVFSNGITNGKINYFSVYKSLKENTWYGQRFEKTLTERDLDKNTSWLSLFAPALNDYFAQIEMGFIMAGKLTPNYILCIDSLTLKFEGALRDFIRLTGGSTTIEKEGEFREQTLEQLLSNKNILDIFSLEDITLFEYVFTNKGWNLRNNVAHCFYPYSNYSFEKATIVLFCILRLGRYQLEQKSTEK